MNKAVPRYHHPSPPNNIHYRIVYDTQNKTYHCEEITRISETPADDANTPCLYLTNAQAIPHTTFERLLRGVLGVAEKVNNTVLRPDEKNPKQGLETLVHLLSVATDAVAIEPNTTKRRKRRKAASNALGRVAGAYT